MSRGKDLEETLNQGLGGKIFTPSNAIKGEALGHIGDCEGVKAIIKEEPDVAAAIKIAGREVWLCDVDRLLSIMDNEINEARKCRADKPNKFE